MVVGALPHYASFLCTDNNAIYCLQKVDKVPSGEGGWTYFEVQDLNAQVQLLITKGISFEELPTDKPWLWREARLKGPDKNKLILYFAGTNRINPPWKIIAGQR